MTQDNLNQLADEYLPAKTPEQRAIVMRKLFNAIDPHEAKSNKLWKDFFEDAAHDMQAVINLSQAKATL